MTLNQEQVKKIKEELLSQIENFPTEQQEQARTQIEKMNAEELEQFLIQNNLLNTTEKDGSKKEETPEQKCIICAIAEGKIKSYKIDENEEVVAVLEINPISKGHIIIIPKKHVTDSKNISKSIFEYAEKISSKLTPILKPKQIMVYSSNVLGHEILNVLPIYKSETPESERKKLSDKELDELQKEILEFKPEKAEEKKKEKSEDKNPEEKEFPFSKIWFPRRIP